MRSISFVSVRLAGILVVMLIAACDRDAAPVEGFYLPPGDIARGQEVFETIGCRYCHTVADLDLPPFEAQPVLSIALGGKVTRIQDYGELLTSIVNPDHTVSARYDIGAEDPDPSSPRSPMPVFGDVMTVTQLIDLTAFLHSHYSQYVPDYRGYQYVP